MYGFRRGPQTLGAIFQTLQERHNTQNQRSCSSLDRLHLRVVAILPLYRFHRASTFGFALGQERLNSFLHLDSVLNIFPLQWYTVEGISGVRQVVLLDCAAIDNRLGRREQDRVSHDVVC